MFNNRHVHLRVKMIQFHCECHHANVKDETGHSILTELNPSMSTIMGSAPLSKM